MENVGSSHSGGLSAGSSLSQARESHSIGLLPCQPWDSKKQNLFELKKSLDLLSMAALQYLVRTRLEDTIVRIRPCTLSLSQRFESSCCWGMLALAYKQT